MIKRRGCSQNRGDARQIDLAASGANAALEAGWKVGIIGKSGGIKKRPGKFAGNEDGLAIIVQALDDA